MGENASKLLLIAVTIAYTSSVGAALSLASGYLLVPHFVNILYCDGLKRTPAAFSIINPQIMPVRQCAY